MTETLNSYAPAVRLDAEDETRSRKLCPKCRVVLDLSDRTCEKCGMELVKKSMPVRSDGQKLLASCVRIASCAVVLGSIIAAAFKYT